MSHLFIHVTTFSRSRGTDKHGREQEKGREQRRKRREDNKKGRGRMKLEAWSQREGLQMDFLGGELGKYNSNAFYSQTL